MSDPSHASVSFRLTAAETAAVMNLLGAATFFGAPPPFPLRLSDEDRRKAEASLVEKGVLQRAGKLRPAEEIRPLLEAVFFPEQALVVFRDVPGKGRQFFHAGRKGKILGIHSLPKGDENYFRAVEDPLDLVPAVVDWFPFYLLPVSAARFRLPQPAFDEIRRLAAAGKQPEALARLGGEGAESAEKQNLIRAIAHRTLSGSIARLRISDGAVVEGDSVALLTDGRTGWLIAQEGPPAAEPELTVRRAGADLAMVVREYVETLAGVKFPQREADGAGRTVRFLLAADELAFALLAINCRDLSAKMYAALSGDLGGAGYAGRMDRARQSLMESGLCSLSERGLPVLDEELARAVFPVAKSDALIQLSEWQDGRTAETGIYIVTGTSFTVYRNYGASMQILECGKFADLQPQLESMFPDFGEGPAPERKPFSVSYGALEKSIAALNDPPAVGRLLAADGIPAAEAEQLSGDMAAADYRAMLRRSDAPDPEKKTGEPRGRADVLLLLRRRDRSWLIRFESPSGKGRAGLAGRAEFREAAGRMIE
jgi:hypothetical protein